MQRGVGLRFGDLGERTAHACVDVERLFHEKTGWRTPWLGRILPQVARIAAAHPGRTAFTHRADGRDPAGLAVGACRPPRP